jgi:hypothetical protein
MRSNTVTTEVCAVLKAKQLTSVIWARDVSPVLALSIFRNLRSERLSKTPEPNTDEDTTGQPDNGCEDFKRKRDDLPRRVVDG